MSKAVSVLQGAHSSGPVTVTEMGLHGMITLKADLGAVEGAVTAITGQPMPKARQMVRGDISVAWMAPDEVLILCDHAQADGLVGELTAALKDIHHLAVNVSDARAVLSVTGAAIKDTLGKLTPADLSALAPGEIRRSRLAQVPAAFWIEDDTATVICFRSVAQYVFDLLVMSGKEGGEVGFHHR